MKTKTSQNRDQTEQYPGDDSFTLRHECIDQINEECQDDQRENFFAKGRELQIRNGMDDQIMIRKRCEGQWRKEQIQIPGLKSVQNNGYGIDEENTHNR
jgi:hypothetical protein